jgi:hypothetical protein
MSLYEVTFEFVVFFMFGFMSNSPFKSVEKNQIKRDFNDPAEVVVKLGPYSVKNYRNKSY